MKEAHRPLSQWAIAAVVAAVTFAALSGVHEGIGKPAAVVAAVAVLVFVAVATFLPSAARKRKRLTLNH